MAVATNKDYATLQRILEEAGRHNLAKQEEMTGTPDGNETDFYVQNTVIVDNNYDDVVDENDVIVYDDGVAVTVSAVNKDTGAVTLASAPATNSVMTATYAFSEITATAVSEVRTEAIDYVQTCLNGIVDYASWETTEVPGVVKTVTRMYAAGLLLIRDYGSHTDTEDTSKDGYKRLEMAKEMMKEYVDKVSDDASSTQAATVQAKSDGNMFYRETDLTNNATREVGSIGEDEHFFRGD